MSAHRSPKLRIAVRLLLFSVVVLAGLIFLTPLPGTLLRRPALAYLEQEYGVTATVRRLDLDVAGLVVEAEDLSLATVDHENEPFLSIDRAVVDLSWSALWGGGAYVDAVSLHGAVVSVRHRADGTSNLPSTAASAGIRGEPPIARSMPIRRFDLRSLTLDWRNDQQDFTLHLPPTSVRLVAGDETAGMARGRLSMDGMGRITWRGTATEVSRLDGDIGFDGAAFDIERLDVAVSEGQLTLRGRVDGLLGRPRPEFQYNARLDLARAAAWRPGTSASGTLTLGGDIEQAPDGLTATASVSARGATWNGMAAERVDADATLTPDAIRVEGLRVETAGGVLTAGGRVARTPERPGRLQAAWAGLDIARLTRLFLPTAPALPRIVAEGSLSAQWTGLDPGSVRLSGESRLVDGPAASGGFRFDGRGGEWRVTLDQRFDAAAHVSGVIEGEFAAGTDLGGGDWQDTPVAGALTVTCTDLERCSRLVTALNGRDAPSRLRGNAAARVEVTGSLGYPVVAAELEAPALTAGALPINDLTARFDLDRESLAISGVGFALGTNPMTGDARIRWEDGAVDGSLSATVRDLSTLAPEILPAWSRSGRGRFDVTAGGSLDRVSAEATFAFEELAAGGVGIGTAHGAARVDGAGGLRVEAQFPDLTATVEASLDLAGADRIFTVRGGITGGDLQRLIPFEVPLSGHVALEGSANGTLAEPATLHAHLTLTGLAGAVDDLDIDLVRPTTLHYGPDSLRVEGLEARIGSSVLRVDGGLDGSGDAALRGNVDGTAADLARLVTVALGRGSAGPIIDAAGDVTAGLTVTGTPNAFELTGDLGIDGGWLAVGDGPRISGLTLRAGLRNGGLHLDTLRADWAGAAIEGSGELPLELVFDALAGRSIQRDHSAHLHARIGALGPAALASYLDPQIFNRIEGRAAVRVDLELPALDLESARGRITMPDGAFVISGIPFEQRRPTEIVIAEGRATIDAFAWGNETTLLRASGGLDLRDALTAQFAVGGDLDLRAAGALLPPLAAAGITTAGSAQLAAVVSGPLSAPGISGTVQVVGADVRLPEPRLAVTDLNGTLLLAGDTVTAYNLAGNANGGRVTINGGWSFGTETADQGFTITGEGLALDVPRGLRSEADVVLRAAKTDGGLGLRGTVTLLRGAYREPITLAGGLLGLLRERLDMGAVRFDDGNPDNLQLDIRVATLEDIVVDNNYLDAELGGNLRIRGSPGAPAITGRMTMREGGQVRFGNRVYEIEVGTVDFADPDGITPDLTLSARTRAGTYDITLNASGGRDELTTSLRSEPPLPESDIVSLLLTGRRLDQAAAPAAGARDQALGLVSTELLGQAGRRVGLDLRLGAEAPDVQSTIRFDSSLIASDLNPGSRLTVGRNLHENVRLVFSRSLRENDLAWLVDYLPADNLELRAFFHDETVRAYEFRHAITAGGPPETARVSGEVVARRARVSTIGFSGDFAADAARLRKLLSLRTGDRFDFHRWQRDLDRLEAFFFERGFLEARIRGRRDQAASSTDLALTYEVARGPRTELAVTGFPLPDSVRRDLETLWTRAVFDTFLIEAFSARVTEYLADRGYLGAVVEVEVETTKDERGPAREGATPGRNTAGGISTKQATVRIEVGPRTEDRRVVFTGVTADDEPQLLALADSPDLATRAWTDPDRLAAAVTAWYRGRGRLRAQTTAGPSRFDGRIARLPVRVAAGPLFRFGTIQVAGTRALTPADALAAAGIEAGEVYTGSSVAAARARIASRYRQAGHTAARITARSTPDDATATVGVRFEVVEGPRQVVGKVVVDGAPRTHQGLVARALRVDPGNPVDTAAWNLARKRLYDTGIFRSVDIEARVPESTGADQADATVPVEARVTLVEWPRYLVRYGLRLSDEAAALGEATGRVLRVGAAAELRRRNLFGRGLTAGISSRADRERQAARAYLTVPTLFGQPIETNLFASRRRDVTGPRDTGFISDVTTFTAEQRLRPIDRLTLAYSANLDLNHTFDRTSDPSFPFDLRLRVMRFDASAVAERRDDLFNATGGSYHSANVEYGTDVGRPVRFLKYLGQHFLYRRTGPLVLASAVRIGLATGFGSDLIPTERFFAGGGNTVRGYAQDSLGPTGVFGAPTGGNALLILNQEARFPLVWRLTGVGFVDAGNVFRSVGRAALRDLRIGAGFGLRIDTPVGLARLDYGLPLDRDPDEPRGRVFVSLGQAF